MAVEENCRHYLRRSTPTGEALERCRLNVALADPFACPEGCLFFEPRRVSSAGWTAPPSVPMSNTASGLVDLPPSPKPGRRNRKKR
jgi:hypothetical protein